MAQIDKKNIDYNKKNKKSLLTLYVLGIFYVLFLIFMQNEDISEWMVRNFYGLYAEVFGPTVALLPFDLFEVLVALVVVFFVFMVIRLVYLFKKKENKRALSLIFSRFVMMLIVGILYLGVAGFAYNRKEIAIPMYEENVNSENIIDIYDAYYKDLNYYCSKIEMGADEYSFCPYTMDEVIDKLIIEYDRLSDENDYFIGFTAKPKPIISSGIMSELNITGVTFLPTIEPGYNRIVPTCDKIEAIAHEMAHTKGVMREKDANLVMYYVLMTSDDDYLRYVGYKAVYLQMRNTIILTNNKSLLQDIYLSPSIIVSDFKYEKEWWSNHSLLSQIGDFFNDIYLRVNGQDGTNSYNNVTDYVEETDENGNIQYTIVNYSNVQKMVFELYKNRI